MIFKTMPTAEVLKALEGQEDILTPAFLEHQRYFKDLSCPRCNSAVMPVVNPRNLYRENALLPNFLAKCTGCECVFEPYTKIEVELPRVPPTDLAPREEDLLTIWPR